MKQHLHKQAIEILKVFAGMFEANDDLTAFQLRRSIQALKDDDRDLNALVRSVGRERNRKAAAASGKAV